MNNTIKKFATIFGLLLIYALCVMWIVDGEKLTAGLKTVICIFGLTPIAIGLIIAIENDWTKS